MKLLSAVVLLCLSSSAFAGEVGATPQTGELQATGAYASIDPGIYNVGNDQGGVVVDYIVKREILRNDGLTVRFNGECNSACTLYITLPSCVTKGAVFGFHAPFGPDQVEVRDMKEFIWREYPQWVRQYINRHGGFNEKLIIMPYSYASRFLPTCD